MRISRWIDRLATPCVRLALATVFVWFGAMKLLDLCPLAGFISRSVPFLPAQEFLLVLGWWEVAIGICLLFRPLVRIGLWLLLLHLPGTTLPLLVIPGECFVHFPYALTLEGQYIVKNLVLASAAIALVGCYSRRDRRRAERDRRRLAPRDERVSPAGKRRPKRQPAALTAAS